MPKPAFQYLSTDNQAPGGGKRYFVRRFGKRIRLRAQYGTSEFAIEYAAAAQALEAGQTQRERDAAKYGTLEWLARRYFKSAEFQQLPADSRATRQGIIEHCLKEPWKQGDSRTFAIVQVNSLGPHHITVLRDRKGAEKPGAANNRLKYLSSMFTWAVQHQHMRFNPCRDVKKLKRKSETGYHAWTLEEYQRFEEYHPCGTKAYLALALLFFCGARRSDLVNLGANNVRGDTIAFVPRKTRHKTAQEIYIPFPKELRDILEASPVGKVAFVETEYGHPFPAAGFGNWFRDRCNEAGLPQCSAHGVRKLAATTQAEGGATDRQLMAFFGWSTPSMASVYVKAANQKHLAAEAGRALELPRRLPRPSKMPDFTAISTGGGGPGRTRTSNQAVMSR
jgi:integrase